VSDTSTPSRIVEYQTVVWDRDLKVTKGTKVIFDMSTVVYVTTGTEEDIIQVTLTGGHEFIIFADHEEFKEAWRGVLR
jgi:hypothetical protein